MEDFHSSNKNSWAGFGMLTYKHSKLVRKLNFRTFKPWLLAAPKVDLFFCHEYNLDQGNVQEHLKCPWAGNCVTSKLHFKYLLCTKIVILMLQTKTLGLISQKPVAFWQKTLTDFLNSLVPTKCVKVGKFWDDHSTNLPDSYKKWLLISISMAISIHGHISYILEANSKRPIRKKKKIGNKVKLCWRLFFFASKNIS